MIAKLPFMNKYNTKYWLMDSEFKSTFKEYVLPGCSYTIYWD